MDSTFLLPSWGLTGRIRACILSKQASTAGGGGQGLLQSLLKDSREPLGEELNALFPRKTVRGTEGKREAEVAQRQQDVPCVGEKGGEHW